jgi:hypothetical protein
MAELKDYQQRGCEALASLFSSDDTRSLAEMIADDPVTEYTVEKAERGKDGWEVSFDDGLVGFFTTDKPIKRGDTLGLYVGGRGAFGSMRHGFAINGDVVEWKTPWERYADRIKMLAGHDRSRREEAEQARADIAVWIEQLRGPYRARIERFRSARPTFDMDGGSYETYPVLMAQRVEDWVRQQHPDAAPVAWDDAVALVKELEAMPYKAQAKVLHNDGEDKYGVSGHQVDMAYGMAAAVLVGTEI